MYFKQRQQGVQALMVGSSSFWHYTQGYIDVLHLGSYIRRHSLLRASFTLGIQVVTTAPEVAHEEVYRELQPSLTFKL